tara:strand:- start:92 stop:1153 length:1062 start_codon:yes stop_codon:yes gene_type:complete
MKNNIEGIVVELLEHKDYKKFQFFIKDHWKIDHIFAHDKSVFEFQHKASDYYHYMIAKKDNSLIGVHGVIPQSKFDESLPSDQIFLGLWKVLDGDSVGLGIFLYQNILKEYSPQFIGVVGYNSDILSFYVWQGFEVGIMNHHVVLSTNKTDYDIAIVPSSINYKRKDFQTVLQGRLIEEKDLNTLDSNKLYSYQIPIKSDTYLINRYMNHPVYDYDVYAIEKDRELLGLTVIRPIIQDQVVVLRLVDYIGSNDTFPLLGGFILQLLDHYEAEYLDMYSYGIPNEIIEQAGFLNRTKYDGLIIPNYFEPFEKKNVDLRYAYKSTSESQLVRLFKADGDQDRPNMLDMKICKKLL